MEKGEGMKKTPKVIEAIKNKSWISVTEYPDETLCLEGIFIHPYEPNAYATTRIRFSKQAIEKLIPLMQNWIDQKRINKYGKSAITPKI